jgi:hypothetical protein
VDIHIAEDELHITSCPHINVWSKPVHFHVIRNGVNEEHQLCDACYAKLCERLFANDLPENWRGKPLTEPVTAVGYPFDEKVLLEQ